MRPQHDIAAVPVEFGHWLAGFYDGEGCFAVRKNGATSHSCFATVKVRRDDAPILREAQVITGIGVVSESKHYTGGNPLVHWYVASRADCMAMVELFDRFPLRAKKAQDFAIWRLAVIEWNAYPLRARRDWSAMAAFKTQLQEGRKYREA